MIQQSVYKLSQLRMTVKQLETRIQQSISCAFRFNAYIDGAIIKMPITTREDGTQVYQQFERSRNGFRDLGFCD